MSYLYCRKILAMLPKFGTLLFVLFINLTGFAQLCQGSLGDPIINITFGQGSNPGPALAAASTSYTFFPNDCPSDGSYTVRSNTTACFGNSWHNLSSDHTGNNGYFMLVNASVTPGAFYVDTVRGLCGNTTFEFAAWVMNVMLQAACNSTGTQPNLTFQIERTDGTIIQSYTTNNIPSSSTPTWQQFGFFFTTPPTAPDLVLRIVNNAPGGCGNDLALDDITFRPCGPLITNSVNGQSQSIINVCEGTSGNYSMSCTVSGGFTTPAYQWQFKGPTQTTWTDITGANSNTYTFLVSPALPLGTFEVRLAVAETGNLNALLCRVYSTPFSITIHPNPTTTAGNNGPVCENGTAQLNATGGATYSWTGPNGFTATQNPLTISNLALNQAGKYYVTVTSSDNCSSSDSTTLQINAAPIAVTNIRTATICVGDSIQLIASGGNSYLWTPAAGLSADNIANPKAAPAGGITNYQVTVTNTTGCTDTAQLNINALTKPTANAGPDKIIIKGQSIILDGSIAPAGYNYAWSPNIGLNNMLTLTPSVSPTADEYYYLTASSPNGCGINIDTVFVKVYDGIFIPSAFSPNGDQRNDTWNIPALAAYPFFRLTVYNRLGQIVFENNRSPKPWDGKFKNNPLPAGAYIYQIDLGNKRAPLKGTVMIIR
ncbi:MAG: hypothetical protein RLY16_636 [Bacteroidota bacterium]